MDFFETTKTTEAVFEGKVVTVRKDTVTLSDGTDHYREVVDHPGGVCIAAVDGDGFVYVVHQFRYPMGEMLTELPAGKLERGEDPLSAAIRELREETGLKADSVDYVGVIYPSPGYCREKLYMYVATGLTPGEQDLDDGELLSVSKLPLTQVLDMVNDNTIKDAKTAFLAVVANNYIQKKKEQGR